MHSPRIDLYKCTITTARGTVARFSSTFKPGAGFTLFMPAGLGERVVQTITEACSELRQFELRADRSYRRH